MTGTSGMSKDTESQATPSPGAEPPAGHWLKARGLRAIPWAFLLIYVLVGVHVLARSDGLLDVHGKPIGYDFVTFWSASKLALEGRSVAAYDPERILETGRAVIPGLEAQFIWSYPPNFHLVVLPLALLPYLWSYLIWSLVWLVPFLLVAKRLAPAPETLWLALAFPGTVLNLVQGQNGLMMAALFGGAMLLLRPRPLLAGILIGLLSCKPHLGVLLPIALACGRHWRAFGAATATTLAFAGISLATFGSQEWLAFLGNIEFATAVLEDGRLPWAKMPSLFAALRLLGLDVAWSYAAQALLALGVAGAVALVWWRPVPFPLAVAVLSSGALLVSPHTNDHDLAILAVPIALLAWYGHRHGWRRGEREVLAAAWISPLVAVIVSQTHLQVGLLCVFALFLVALMRAIRPGAAPASQGVL